MSNQHMLTHTHGPPGQWGQSTHGLLIHCALAELQHPADTVAVTMVQMLLLAPLLRLATNGTTFCVFSLQFKPLLFIT